MHVYVCLCVNLCMCCMCMCVCKWGACEEVLSAVQPYAVDLIHYDKPLTSHEQQGCWAKLLIHNKWERERLSLGKRNKKTKKEINKLSIYSWQPVLHLEKNAGCVVACHYTRDINQPIIKKNDNLYKITKWLSSNREKKSYLRLVKTQSMA